METFDVRSERLHLCARTLQLHHKMHFDKPWVKFKQRENSAKLN